MSYKIGTYYKKEIQGKQINMAYNGKHKNKHKFSHINDKMEQVTYEEPV